MALGTPWDHRGAADRGGAQAGKALLVSCTARTQHLEAKGFVRTGADLGDGHAPLETSRNRVFAIGDVRAGSAKRVASAVGEGAQVIAATGADPALRVNARPRVCPSA
jgi:thioredoxin reductase